MCPESFFCAVSEYGTFTERRWACIALVSMFSGDSTAPHRRSGNTGNSLWVCAAARSMSTSESPGDLAAPEECGRHVPALPFDLAGRPSVRTPAFVRQRTNQLSCTRPDRRARASHHRSVLTESAATRRRRARSRHLRRVLQARWPNRRHSRQRGSSLCLLSAAPNRRVG